MSKDKGAGNPPDRLTVVLLALAVLSVVWIITRTIYTMTFSAPSTILLSVYLLSLIFLFLTGSLIMKRPWSLVPLSLLGMSYMFLTLILLLIRSETILDLTWLITVTCIGYMAIIKYLNPVRTHVGLDPLSVRDIAAVGLAYLVFLATCTIFYSVYVTNFFPGHSYRVRSMPYSVLEEVPVTSVPYTWSSRWRVAVPETLDPLEVSPGIGIWTNGDGDKVIVSDDVWTQRIYEYSFTGFKDPYDFERSIWDAGVTQPVLLLLKFTMSSDGIRVYYLEAPRVKAIVALQRNPDQADPAWSVSTNIYPTDQPPYNMETFSKKLERALLPVRLTLETYLQ